MAKDARWTLSAFLGRFRLTDSPSLAPTRRFWPTQNKERTILSDKLRHALGSNNMIGAEFLPEDRDLVVKVNMSIRKLFENQVHFKLVDRLR